MGHRVRLVTTARRIHGFCYLCGNPSLGTYCAGHTWAGIIPANNERGDPMSIKHMDGQEPNPPPQPDPQPDPEPDSE